MGDVGLEICWEIHNAHGVAGAELGSMETGGACLLEDADVAVNDGDAFAAARAGDLGEELVCRHVRLAFLLVEDENTLGMARIGLPGEAFLVGA